MGFLVPKQPFFMTVTEQCTRQKDDMRTEKAEGPQLWSPSLAPSCCNPHDKSHFPTPPAAPYEGQVEQTAEDSHQ